jgi:hypothetical protein
MIDMLAALLAEQRPELDKKSSRECALSLLLRDDGRVDPVSLSARSRSRLGECHPCSWTKGLARKRRYRGVAVQPLRRNAVLRRITNNRWSNPSYQRKGTG